ncbi:uncharacterized protein LOC126474645 [Schistocerca serialis cubense]|uniref:uncharacterized protein LOC126474645 n=1 Tax=Schistocerca serialis cubense TaxID=2023355 RepID=UPI00214E5E2E|nr:uncharacterized protein LOC126474645 [Schistocerca serialis cubense]
MTVTTTSLFIHHKLGWDEHHNTNDTRKGQGHCRTGWLIPIHHWNVNEFSTNCAVCCTIALVGTISLSQRLAVLPGSLWCVLPVCGNVYLATVGTRKWSESQRMEPHGEAATYSLWRNFGTSCECLWGWPHTLSNDLEENKVDLSDENNE